jgi:hypothetical protein
MAKVITPGSQAAYHRDRQSAARIARRRFETICPADVTQVRSENVRPKPQMVQDGWRYLEPTESLSVESVLIDDGGPAKVPTFAVVLGVTPREQRLADWRIARAKWVAWSADLRRYFRRQDEAVLGMRTAPNQRPSRPVVDVVLRSRWSPLEE